MCLYFLDFFVAVIACDGVCFFIMADSRFLHIHRQTDCQSYRAVTETWAKNTTLTENKITRHFKIDKYCNL